MTGIAVAAVVTGILLCAFADVWWKWFIGLVLGGLGGLFIESVIVRLFHSIWRLQDHLGLEDDYEIRHK